MRKIKFSLVILILTMAIPCVTNAKTKESKRETVEDVKKREENGYNSKTGEENTHAWFFKHWEDAQKALDKQWKDLQDWMFHGGEFPTSPYTKGSR